MDLIDTNLDAYEKKSRTRGLNGLLLAAYLLYHLGSSNFNFIYSDIYKDFKPETGILLTLVHVLCTIGAAVLCDLTRQGRVLTIIGFGLMLMTGLVSYFSDTLTGLPMAVFFYTAQALVGITLLQRLLYNTVYFGTAQQSILISMAGVHLLTVLFYQVTRIMAESNENLTGQLLVGFACAAAGLVLVIVDNEKEEHLPMSIRDYTEHNPGFWLGFVLPFVFVSLAMQWTEMQPQRVFYYSVSFDRGNQFQPFVAIVNLLLAGGLLALLVFVARLKKPFIYMGIGLGLVLIALLMGLGIGADDNIPYSKLWLMAVLCTVGGTIGTFGLNAWICRHTKFPMFASLLAFNTLLPGICYALTEYFNLFVTDQHFTFSNF